jgi:hypothetical protein
MPVWTIAGEAAKSWDATQQTLAYRAIDGGTLEFRSLDVDTLTLAIVPEDFTTYTMPELGQLIRLYRNGTLFFTGHVTDTPFAVSANAQTISVVVSGAWWWMERINYVTTQTDGTGATASRMTGVFGDATSGTNLKTAIESAIDRCVVLGVPIANIAGGSSVATYFQVPRVTLNQGTCAFVITELVRLVPDTMVYFDYSTTTPTIVVTRRGVATTRALTIGTDPIESIDVRPVFEMKVDQVVLPYVERDVLGRTQFNQQSSGTATTGKIQVVTMSGPELDTFLPNDLFDTQPVRTYSTLETFVLASDRQFDNAKDIGLTTELVINSSATTFNYYSSIAGINNSSFLRSQTIPATIYLGEDGEPVNPAGLFFLTPEQVADWAIDEYGLIPVVASGTWAYDWKSQTDFYNPDSSYIRTDIFPIPAWFSSLQSTKGQGGWRGLRTAAQSWDLYTGTFTASGFLSATNYHWAGTARSGSGATTIVLATAASSVDDFYTGRTVTWRKSGGAKFTDTITDYVGSTRAATLSQSWISTQRPATGDTYELEGHPLYRPADYSFIAPPASLAANLLAAQNFTPYEGSISITEETAGTTRYRGCVVNIANSITAHASMAALVSGESLDLKSGITQIALGTPPRLDYRTFVDRIRKTPQDNIVFDV